MALQTSGAISLWDVQGEFGGSSPIGINEYYGADTGVPSSGTISLSNFYGKSSGPPRYTWSREGNVDHGRAYEEPGFGGVNEFIDHYPLRNIGGISSGGPVDMGLVTQGTRTAYPPKYSDFIGVQGNPFNRLTLNGTDDVWDFRTYTHFTVEFGPSGGEVYVWSVTNPIWSTTQGLNYLSGGLVKDINGNTDDQYLYILGQQLAKSIDTNGSLYMKLDFLS